MGAVLIVRTHGIDATSDDVCIVEFSAFLPARLLLVTLFVTG
jgi:hypothetical protein